MIPLCNLESQYLQLKPQIDAAMQRVAKDGRYILGPEVKAFEKEMAAYCECQFAVGVANGTDALHLALRGLRIGPGDEVITTPFTFIATTEAIGMVGAKAVFVDIDPHTFNIDVGQIESAVTDRTKAIIPVHLYGQPCEMVTILQIAERYGLYVVEDCAQALGARYLGRPVGTWGDVGCLSFFPSKNLGCLGDGGMVITNNLELGERIEMLRRHGGKVKYYHDELGINSRLDELQAAILRVKLPHLDVWNDMRRNCAATYNHLLRDIDVTCPVELGQCDATEFPPADRVVSVYHQYTIQVDQRDVVAQTLTKKGIGNAVYYPVPLHLQKVNQLLGRGKGAFPCAERVADRCLSLPMFPGLSRAQQECVVPSLTEAMDEASWANDRVSMCRAA